MPHIHDVKTAIVQRTRKSPFFDATVRWGVKGFSVYNHMLMPIWYESPEADYWHLVTNVTMWDVGVERQVEITGPDAYKLVRLMTPRNLEKCRVGVCKYVPIIDDKGGVLNDPLLLPIGKNHFWLSLADSDIEFYAKGLAIGYGLDVDIKEPDVSPLAIQGPNWLPVARNLFGDWIEKLRFFRFREVDLDGIPLVVARSGWSKKGGLELYLRDGSYGDRLWDMVAEAGKAYDIRPATPNTIERIESGLLSFGNDMTSENNPFECGLGQYCDVDQEFDFIGKAALQRIKREGVKQTLVGLTIDGDRKPGNEHWWDITCTGRPAGRVTSATYSPRLKKNIALAMVPIKFSQPGTRLCVHAVYGDITATVTELPFL